MDGQIKTRLILLADDQEYYGTHIEFGESVERDLSEDLRHGTCDYIIKAEEFVDTPDGLRSFFRTLVSDLCKDGDEYAEVRKGDAADFLKAISDPDTGDEIAERAIANMTYAFRVSCGLYGTLAHFIADAPGCYSSGNELNIMGRRLGPWMKNPKRFIEDAKSCVLRKDKTKNLRAYKSFFGDPTAEAIAGKKRDETKRRIRDAQKRAAKARREFESAQRALEKAQGELAAAMGIGQTGKKR
jgi:hypothetical protein